MILMLVVVVLVAGFYWGSSAFRRRVDWLPGSTGRRGHRSSPPKPPAPGQRQATTSMMWTAVDERQFRRLTDGPPSDDGA